jgi:flavin reductase (DIM6/NTAB) family NADH-FMN oxidoreductase RutF
MGGTHAMKRLALADVYRLIEPGPVVLLTTAAESRDRAAPGSRNVMALSWHMMVEFEPPLIACVVSERDYSFRALRATRECVIAIPPAALADEVVGVGNTHAGPGRADKFRRFALTPLDAGEVRAPLIAECFANLECRVVDTRMVNRYNLFILEVVRAWIGRRWSAERHPPTIHHRGRGRFTIDGKTVRLASKVR